MNIYRMVLKVVSKIKADNIFLYSSQASFYLLISAVPFLTLFISFLKYFFNVAESEISNILVRFFPEAVQSIVESLLNETFNKPSVSLISFSVISLLWTSSRGVSGLKRGVKFIYNIPNKSFFKDILSSILMVFVMIIVALLLICVSLFSASLRNTIAKLVFSILFMANAFNLVYFLFSKRKFSFAKYIPGSLFATFSWIIFIKIFSLYINSFSNYSYVYGSLTALLLLALWIYFSTIIFFLGAELNIMISSSFLKDF